MLVNSEVVHVTDWVAESIFPVCFRREGPLIISCSNVCHKCCPVLLHSPWPWLSLHDCRFYRCKFGFSVSRICNQGISIHRFWTKPANNSPGVKCSQASPHLPGSRDHHFSWATGGSKTRANTEHMWISQKGIQWAIYGETVKSVLFLIPEMTRPVCSHNEQLSLHNSVLGSLWKRERCTCHCTQTCSLSSH